VELLRRLKQFMVETWVELHKTTWPGRKEVYGTTVVVIVAVFVCALFLFIVDLCLSNGMEAILRMFNP
jgi:preprotein translocase SecE subunit